MNSAITTELVSLDVPLGADKSAVITALAQRVADTGRATDAAGLYAAAWAREEQDETGLPGGIAIPHAKTAAVTVPSLAFARLSPGVDFGADDGPADLVFLIAAPADADEAHLGMLSSLARALMTDEFTDALRAAVTPDDVVSLVRVAVGEEEAAPVTTPTSAPRTSSTSLRYSGSRWTAIRRLIIASPARAIVILPASAS